jgi:intracellular sulfur oxidation DsrE/DsrF family protein
MIAMMWLSLQQTRTHLCCLRGTLICLQFVAQKFKCTYGREAHGGLAETLLNSVHLLDLGNAAEVFIDVDMVAAVASINQDTSRMTVVYQSLDGVSMVVCGITLAAYAQAVAAGMDTVPCGKATPKELWQELKTALASIVSKANDSKGALSEASIIELALARMALAELLAW